MADYYTSQIITYMGNKRKILPYIETIILALEEKEGRPLHMGDGFSGSGIVSRLFKKHASTLYTNDISSYSYTLNTCYLSNISDCEKGAIQKHIDIANELAANPNTKCTTPFISGHWAPSETTIKETDRVYFTHSNGKRIDIYRSYIETLPEKIKPFLLGRLLVEASIHNNTSGHFSAFYKNGNIGQYGGKKSIDLGRIEKDIVLSLPVTLHNKCDVHIDKMDVIDWVKSIPELDLVYFDPPYNKHPYNIYYFLLDIIQEWNTNISVPATTRGQPMGWSRSPYNSFKHAYKEFEKLIANTNAKYVLVSYNNGGIIPLDKMEELLMRYGTIEITPVQHKTYNRLKGISEYKRTKEKETIREFLWLLTKKKT